MQDQKSSPLQSDVGGTQATNRDDLDAVVDQRFEAWHDALCHEVRLKMHCDDALFDEATSGDTKRVLALRLAIAKQHTEEAFAALLEP